MEIYLLSFLSMQGLRNSLSYAYISANLAYHIAKCMYEKLQNTYQRSFHDFLREF
jgi:hypothetical protein